MTAVAAGPRLHPAIRDGLELEVARVDSQGPSIRSFTFRDPAGKGLPAYVPGSHVLVQCGSKANAYSLTGSGLSPDGYTVSVLEADGGKGGSAWMHRLAPGDRVQVSRPRSAFAPVATARHHLLVAAGIGITPLLSHARAALEWGRSVSLVYTYRPGGGAHVAELRDLLGDRLRECSGRNEFHQVLAAELGRQKLGTHLYTCGPQPFMDQVQEQAASAGWPASRLHSEPFGSAALDPGKPFTATLARSQKTVQVPAGTSLLEALEAAGQEVPNLCRQGVCGECALTVLAGRPQHRDLYLSDDEKTSNKTLMCCVSRSHDQEMELDL
jgi:dimethylamine monooxygenase subunit B